MPLVEHALDVVGAIQTAEQEIQLRLVTSPSEGLRLLGTSLEEQSLDPTPRRLVQPSPRPALRRPRAATALHLLLALLALALLVRLPVVVIPNIVHGHRALHDLLAAAGRDGRALQHR